MLKESHHLVVYSSSIVTLHIKSHLCNDSSSTETIHGEVSYNKELLIQEFTCCEMILWKYEAGIEEVFTCLTGLLLQYT